MLLGYKDWLGGDTTFPTYDVCVWGSRTQLLFVVRNLFTHVYIVMMHTGDIKSQGYISFTWPRVCRQEEEERRKRKKEKGKRKKEKGKRKKEKGKREEEKVSVLILPFHLPFKSTPFETFRLKKEKN